MKVRISRPFTIVFKCRQGEFLRNNQHLSAKYFPGQRNLQIQLDEPCGFRQYALGRVGKKLAGEFDDPESVRLEALGNAAMCECQPVIEKVEVFPWAVGEVGL